MNDYTVVWEIKITAESTIEAAAEAMIIQKDPDSHATRFKVNGESIDLSSEDVSIYDWQQAIVRNTTLLGYRDWVQEQTRR